MSKVRFMVAVNVAATWAASVFVALLCVDLLRAEPAPWYERLSNGMIGWLWRTGYDAGVYFGNLF